MTAERDDSWRLARIFRLAAAAASAVESPTADLAAARGFLFRIRRIARRHPDPAGEGRVETPAQALMPGDRIRVADPESPYYRRSGCVIDPPPWAVDAGDWVICDLNDMKIYGFRPGQVERIADD